MASEPLAFVGLGIMGLPMATRLLDAGHPLTVHSRTKSRAQPLLDRGAAWADTPARAAAAARFTFICVPDTPDVEAVLFDDGGIASGAPADSTLVDHSTISPSATRRFAERLAEKNLHLLDAPVSGGDIGARNGTLSIMVGGDEARFSAARPFFEAMGKTLTYCGVSGTGQLTKLTNNILVAINNLAVCEALAFAAKNDLDLTKTIGAISGGAAGSWQLSNLGPKMVAGDFKPGFMIKLQQKDLNLALKAAEPHGLHLSALQLVHELFDRALDDGRGVDGTQALFAVVQKLATASAHA